MKASLLICLMDYHCSANDMAQYRIMVIIHIHYNLRHNHRIKSLPHRNKKEVSLFPLLFFPLRASITTATMDQVTKVVLGCNLIALAETNVFQINVKFHDDCKELLHCSYASLHYFEDLTNLPYCNR